MRRGDVGPAGAVTLALVLGVQAAALAQAAAQVVGHAGGPGTVRAAGSVGAVTLLGLGAGRVTLPLACSRGVPAARPGGLGAAVAGTVPVAGTVLLVAASTAVAAAGTTAVGAGPLPGAAAVLAACAAGGRAAGALHPPPRRHHRGRARRLRRGRRRGRPGRPRGDDLTDRPT